MSRNPMFKRLESSSEAPFTRDGAFSSGFQRAEAGEATMSVGGTVSKTGILLAIILVTATVGWLNPAPILMFASFAVAFVCSLVAFFKPATAPVTAPLYALFKGYAIGGISVFANASLIESGYSLGVPVAILGTLLCLGVMLGLYSSRIIKVNQTFIMVVVGATIAIAATYLFTFVGGMFFPGLRDMPIYGNGPVGILFSVAVIGLAAFNLALDFHVIENGVNSRQPKVMEWHGALGLVVTLVWLYLEILRLLQKLRR